MANQGAELVRYNAMCSAIAAAYKIDEVKNIRDKAVALEHYARQAKNTKAEREACEIRLRAERKAGQLIAKTVKAKGGRPGNGKPVPPGNRLYSRKQSANWQKLGGVPEQQFEAALQSSEKPTTKGIIKATEEPKPKPVSDDALWLWGRLRDFSKQLLGKEPEEVLSTMTPQMQDDVHTLAPKVAAWLKRIGVIRVEETD